MGLLGETKPVKKPILGVSLYPEQESMEEIENYLTMASRYGFTKIFTSMFSVPGTKKEVFDYFKIFCDLAHKHGMKVSGDCNTAFFKKMGASESDISIFKEMGIDIIRMDLPYFDQRDVTLINNPYNITIELSSCMIQAVRMALENGANPKNFSTCHNFYPERYTASDLESIRSINKGLATLGIPSAVFISSNEDYTHGPWPVHDGLPTVEDHRWIPAELQVRHWIAVGDVDEIIFGNAFASEEEFKAIDRVMNQAYVNIPKLVGEDYLAELLPHGDVERVPFKVILDDGVTDLEKEILFDNMYHQCGETPYYMIRSRWTRMFYGKKNIPERKIDEEYYHRGDVVIVNDNLAHYRGEVQIVLKDMKVDGQRNRIGHIPEADHILLNEVKAGRSFCFMNTLRSFHFIFFIDFFGRNGCCKEKQLELQRQL